MTKLLFIGALPEPITGQSLACKVLLDGLAGRYDVEVVNLSKSGFKQGMDSFRRVLEVLGVLWRTWRGRHADVLYFTVSESAAGNLKDLAIYFLCWRHLGRMYIHLHGGAGLRTIMLGRNSMRRRVNEFFARRLRGAIVLGHRHVDIFANVLPPAKVHVVANFAEDYLFSNERAVVAKFSRREPLRLLFLSNLIPGKGYLELVDAYLALEPAEREGLVLDLAGGFESDEQKDAFLKKIAAEGTASYHGVVRGERKKELLTSAHVFLLPTYYPYEGQPISILEAYAAGCAVVTTDHSGIFDIFTPGLNGYAVGKRSVEDLKNVLARLRRSSEPLLEMALANFHAAAAHFRPATYCANMLAVLQTDVGYSATENKAKSE